MPDRDAVAAALARLANDATLSAGSGKRGPARTGQSTPPPPESVVAEAAQAFRRLSTAATFVDGGGEQRLSRAIDDAKRDGDHAIVDRGNELLATLERFRAAPDCSVALTNGWEPVDHFHHGHTTLLAGDGVGSKR